MVDPNISFFNRIYDSCYAKVASYVIAKCGNILDAEDILQEVFIELYNLALRKGISYIDNPEAMVMQIAKFRLHKHYKSGEKLKRLMPLYAQNEEGEEYETVLDDIEIPDKLVNKETVDEIWRLLQSKPQEIQKIFALYFYCGNTAKEIAIYLESSESAIKHKLYRTLAEIRKFYKKDVQL